MLQCKHILQVCKLYEYTKRNKFTRLYTVTRKYYKNKKNKLQ